MTEGSPHGLPRVIVVDNGPEFAGRALDQWAHCRAVQLHFIRRGRPVESCFIESFNGKFRDECLNENWFTSIEDAQRRVEHWRRDYNHVRPHSSLGGGPPLRCRRFRRRNGMESTTWPWPQEAPMGGWFPHPT